MSHGPRWLHPATNAFADALAACYVVGLLAYGLVLLAIPLLLAAGVAMALWRWV